MRLYQTVGAATTRFLYDGDDAIAEYNGANALQRRFVFDPTNSQPVLWYEGTGTAATNRRYLSEDERGSVISVSDSTGVSMGINTYDEYGKPGTGNVGRYQYTGQKWVGEAGVYDYKIRDYLPHLGVFAQTDPIGQQDNANLYAYVRGNPVNLTDPSGLSILVSCMTKYANVSVGDNPPNGGPKPFTTCSYTYVPSYGSPQVAAKITIPSGGKSHHYKVSEPVLCPASTAFANLKEEGNSAPGAPAAAEGITKGIRLSALPWQSEPYNPITQIVDSGTFTILNITEPGHRYYPGTVRISVEPLSQESSLVTMEGVGWGNNRAENMAVGEAAFGAELQGLATICGGALTTPVTP
jgi:RHS repeat-associated protein